MLRVGEASLERAEELFLREKLLPALGKFALRAELELAQLVLCSQVGSFGQSRRRNWTEDVYAPSRLSCSSLMRTLCVAKSSGLTLASWPAPYPAPIESPTRLRESFSDRKVS